VSKLFVLLAWSYVVAAAGASLLGFAATFGWFGIKPDALGMVFAMLAALPWSLAMGLIAGDKIVIGIIVIIAGMGINAMLLFALARAVRRR